MKKSMPKKGFLWFTALCKALPAVLVVTVLLFYPARPLLPPLPRVMCRPRWIQREKEAVAGNVLIWFLCAVSFLKISQKIDSFMASLGVNVGQHTGEYDGGIATKGLSTVRNASSRHLGGGRSGSGPISSGRGSKSGERGRYGAGL